MNEFELLKARVDELKQWMESTKKQQLDYPLDWESTQIIQKDLLVATGKEHPFLFTDLIAFGLEVDLNGVKTVLYASLPMKEFTADDTTDVCTYVNGTHGLLNDDVVNLATTNTLPDPLDTATDYYVIDATASTFKLSTSSGGSAVDITDTGTGSHYFLKTN